MDNSADLAQPADEVSLTIITCSTIILSPLDCGIAIPIP
jgi:hypothetical protein